MKLDDFDFDLPARLIATRPVRPRSAARLLAVTGDEMRDLHVRDLPALLRDGDLLVLNDTRVIPARLHGTRLSYTVETPVSDELAERIAVHTRTVKEFLSVLDAECGR